MICISLEEQGPSSDVIKNVIMYQQRSCNMIFTFMGMQPSSCSQLSNPRFQNWKVLIVIVCIFVFRVVLCFIINFQVPLFKNFLCA